MGLIVGGAYYFQNVTFNGYFHFRANLAGKFTFRAFNFDQIVFTDSDGYASWDFNRCITNS